MCQILGMNCAAPTDFSFSLRGFCRRGGATDVHSHGFGLCVYNEKDSTLQSYHDTQPACQSKIAAELVHRQHPIRTHNMISHIRYATQGKVCLDNVHPFTRKWKGTQLCFCHNGECPTFSNISADGKLPLLGKTEVADQIYRPVGDTDSEAVFCAILNALHAEFPDDGEERLPDLHVLHEFLKSVCDEIIAHHPQETIFNFVLGCGQYTQFAYSWPGKRPGGKVWNGLYYIIREPPFTTARLLDMCGDEAAATMDFAAVTTPHDRVAVITTKPLTSEPGWIEFQRGEILMFHKGHRYRRSPPSSLPSATPTTTPALLCSSNHMNISSETPSSSTLANPTRGELPFTSKATTTTTTQDCTTTTTFSECASLVSAAQQSLLKAAAAALDQQQQQQYQLDDERDDSTKTPTTHGITTACPFGSHHHRPTSLVQTAHATNTASFDFIQRT